MKRFHYSTRFRFVLGTWYGNENGSDGNDTFLRRTVFFSNVFDVRDQFYVSVECVLLHVLVRYPVLVVLSVL